VCFERLHRVLSSNKIALRTTFNAYDREAIGHLSLDNFANMMARLDSKFSRPEIEALFEAVDANRSKAIEFEELHAYYCKVNDLPLVPEFTESRVE
jgi:Ca2+-binding EF-hand superfamily protein